MRGRGSLIITGEYTHTLIKKKSLINKILKSTLYTIFYIIFTFYALFGDDVRHFVSNKQIDFIFYLIFIFTFLFFVVDMVLLTIKKKKYFLSILFFLDLVGTFSLLLDIGWINQFFFNTTDMNVYGVLARGARSALLANSAFKYLEVLRYLKKITLSNLFSCSVFHKMKDDLYKKKIENKRRLEIYKINKITNKTKNKKPKVKKTIKDIYLIGKEMQKEKETTISNSGQEVSTLFTQRTAILILILMSLLPIFYTESYYTRKLTSYEIDLNTIQFYTNTINTLKTQQKLQSTNEALILRNEGFQKMWQEYKNVNTDDDYELLKLILFKKGDLVVKEFPIDGIFRDEDITKDFRYYEFRVFEAGRGNEYYLVSYFSIKKYLSIDAALNMFRTIFVLILLFISVYYYSVEMNELLIEPLENMMDSIFEINKNPIEAYKNIKKTNDDNKKKNMEVKVKNVWGKQEMDELIEKLYKSCQLLSLGFGEAGNELIVKKLKGTNLSLKQGNKIMAIFGFCHIRNFSKYTEDLRDEILEFINSIAYIVHSNVEENNGKVNKNIGDTFLIVWKFNHTITEYMLLEEENENNDLLNKSENKKYKTEITKKCESSIRSFIYSLISIKKKDHLKVLINLRKKSQNKKKKQNPKSFKYRKIESYTIQMSFGLHMGYAIEGAIGSNYKIDLSYLSPHVNLASRVMAATSQYNLNLLISNKVIKHLTKPFQSQFRIIDVVFLKGSKKKVQLYTFDLDLRKRVLDELKKKEFKNKEKEVEICRRVFKREFFEEWNKGFGFYVEGEWRKAYEVFFKLKRFVRGREDGPCKNLEEFIEECGFVPPIGWNGVRSLLKK